MILISGIGEKDAREMIDKGRDNLLSVFQAS